MIYFEKYYFINAPLKSLGAIGNINRTVFQKKQVTCS